MSDVLVAMEQDRRFSALNYTPSGVMHPGWYNSSGILVSNEGNFDNLAMVTPAVSMPQNRFSTLTQSPGHQNHLLEAVSALENNRGANEELYSAAAAAAIALHQSNCSNFSQQLLTNYQQRFNTVSSSTAPEQKPVQDPTVDSEFQPLN
ncbi:hypothetical protein Ciccas_014196 [Cichlidogyrus casuarinus]|uniref:Uncharacterized protein n=1 Tax=Cichlidogyrus casuarinus TaxID=1844966 RepID=A0ABD2PJB2_9PLAT